MFKKLEALANVSLIMVSILLVVVLVQKQLLSGDDDQASEISSGVRIPLAGVDWTTGQETLFVVLQNRCHFCSESAPFYRRVAAEAAVRDVRLIAVSPQPDREAREYLESLQVPIQDIRQVPLQTLKVRGTPTLILVDRDGVVKKVWRGKLPPVKEAEVIASLETCASCEGP